MSINQSSRKESRNENEEDDLGDLEERMNRVNITDEKIKNTDKNISVVVKQINNEEQLYNKKYEDIFVVFYTYINNIIIE